MDATEGGLSTFGHLRVAESGAWLSRKPVSRPRQVISGNFITQRFIFVVQMVRTDLATRNSSSFPCPV